MSTKNTKPTKTNTATQTNSVVEITAATTGTTGTDTSAVTEQEASDVVIYKTATASKLSLRSTGLLTYQLGYVESAHQLFVRLQENETGGYFSKEWVPMDEVYRCLSTFATTKTSFTAVALKECFLSKSQNNAGFLAAVLKAEGLIHCESGKSNLLLFDEAHYQLWLKQNFSLAEQSDPLLTATTVDRSAKASSGTDSDPTSKSKSGSKTSSKAASTTTTDKSKSVSSEAENDLSPEEEAAILDAASVSS